MPGVGVIDAGMILDLVAQQRALVMASVVVQLVSAALFAPGLLGVAAVARSRRARLLEAATEAMLPVMERLQGDGVRQLTPLVLAFFVDSIASCTNDVGTAVVACGITAKRPLVTSGQADAGEPDAKRHSRAVESGTGRQRSPIAAAPTLLESSRRWEVPSPTRAARAREPCGRRASRRGRALEVPEDAQGGI